MTAPNAEHLRGPWQAVIACAGDAYDSVRTARIELGMDGEVDISVRRGSAAPDDGWLPGIHQTGDVAYELEYVPLTPDGDESVAAEARFAQAQAMAAGLNAAATS
jgi:hypothetical protein